MTTRKRRKKASLWMLLLFLIGGGMVLLALTQSLSVTQLGDEARDGMTPASVQRAEKKAKGKTAPFDYSQTTQLNPLTVADHRLRAATGTSQYGAVGQIRVPAVGLELPIGIGVSNSVLVRGAGTLKPDQKMGQGNYALAGHYMTAQRLLFSPLKGVRKGDRICLPAKRKLYTYRTTSVRIVDRHQVEVLNDVPGKKLVTLVTCASAKRGEPKRLVVQGDLQAVKRAPASQA